MCRVTASAAPRSPRDWRVRALVVAVVVLALALAGVTAWGLVTRDHLRAQLALAQVTATTTSLQCDGQTVPFTPTLELDAENSDEPDRPDPGFLIDYSTVRRGCTAQVAIENPSTRAVRIHRYELEMLGVSSFRPFSAARVRGLGDDVEVGPGHTSGRSRVVLAPGSSRTLRLEMPRQPRLCQSRGVVSAPMIEVRVSTPGAERTFESRDLLKVRVPESMACRVDLPR